MPFVSSTLYAQEVKHVSHWGRRLTLIAVCSALTIGMVATQTWASTGGKKLVGATMEVEHAVNGNPDMATAKTTGHFNTLGDVSGSVSEVVGPNGGAPTLTLIIKLSTSKHDALKIKAHGPATDAQPNRNPGYAYNLKLSYKVISGTGKYAHASGHGTIHGWSFTTPTSPDVTELLRWSGTLKLG